MAVQQYFAEHFDDEAMQQRFQNMQIDPAAAGRLD